MKLNSLEDLFKECLKDIYSAENQILKAMPKIIKRIGNEELKSAFQTHFEETEGQVERLNKIAELIGGVRLTGKKCAAMEGLIEEAKELLEVKAEEVLLDCALIGAAQKIEHYEISAYGTARAIAEQLELDEVVSLLEETLEEESATDEKLTALSEGGLLEEAHLGSQEEDMEVAEEEEEEAPAKKTKSSKGRGAASEATR